MLTKVAAFAQPRLMLCGRFWVGGWAGVLLSCAMLKWQQRLSLEADSKVWEHLC